MNQKEAFSGGRCSLFRGRGFFLLLSILLMTVFLSACQSRVREYRLSGIAMLEKGQYEEAISEFQKALEESHGQISYLQFDILKYRAEAEYMLGRLDDAEKTVEILAQAEGAKRDVEALRKQIEEKRLIQQASLALNEGRLSEAKQALLRAKAAGLGSDRDYLFDEAVYLEKIGNWKAAYEAFKNYNALFGSDEEAVRELQFLKLRVSALNDNPELALLETSSDLSQP